MDINCKDSDNFEFDRRVKHGCGFNFELSPNQIYQISYTDYFGENKEQFYTMCPRCGYIIQLDMTILDDYEIKSARLKSINDSDLYLKNDILSEYTNVVERGKHRKRTL